MRERLEWQEWERESGVAGMKKENDYSLSGGRISFRNDYFGGRWLFFWWTPFRWTWRWEWDVNFYMISKLCMDSDGQHLKPQGYHWSLAFISTFSLFSVLGIAYSALILNEFLISDFDFACGCLFLIYMWLMWSLLDMKWVFIFVSKFSHRERCLQVRESMHAEIKSEGVCQKEKRGCGCVKRCKEWG